jgi:RimJ/RimL family protein N-acetyltransferase
MTFENYEGVYLIPFKKEHIEKTFEWVKDPFIKEYFLLRGEHTWKGHLKYFERVLNDPKQQVFAIFVDGHHIGNCGFKNMVPKEREGELWIYIGDESFRNKGFGRFATDLLIREGFDELDLELIYLHVADFNVPARTIYRQIGFVEVESEEDRKGWEDRVCEIIRMERKK